MVNLSEAQEVLANLLRDKSMDQVNFTGLNNYFNKLGVPIPESINSILADPRDNLLKELVFHSQLKTDRDRAKGLVGALYSENLKSLRKNKEIEIFAEKANLALSKN